MKADPQSVIARTNMKTLMRKVFSAKQRIQCIKSTDDIEKTHCYNYQQLAEYDTVKRRWLSEEDRPAIMEWVVMIPLGA